MIRDKYAASDPDQFINTIQRAARAAVAHRIKARARIYAKHPMALEPLYPSLSCAPVATLIAVAEHLVERESRSPQRWFGFGGEVSLVNAKAALLLGRARRRIRELADQSA
jgi:hypothetical protein